MTTNPVAAFTEVTPTTDCIKTTEIQKGVYAFEDLWPEAGDYDMNDVVVEASATKTTARDFSSVKTIESGYEVAERIVSSNSYLKEEQFRFNVGQNYATKQNGLAFKIVSAEGFSMDMIDNVTMTIGGVSCPPNYSDGVFYLTNNVKEVIEKEIVLTIAYKHEEYNKTTGQYEGTYISSQSQSDIRPFIFRSEGNKNWEVHIPYEEPSAKMNFSYFGKNDDQSNPETGAYYVRSGNYPFAFYLAGATLNDVAPLLDSNNESKRIDQLYPLFLDWANSQGKKNPNWYLSK